MPPQDASKPIRIRPELHAAMLAAGFVLDGPFVGVEQLRVYAGLPGDRWLRDLAEAHLETARLREVVAASRREAIGPPLWGHDRASAVAPAPQPAHRSAGQFEIRSRR